MSVKRDAFTMPKEDFELLLKLKLRCMKMSIEVNKSELVRCGLHSLDALTDEMLGKLVSTLPKIRAGRPPKANVNIAS